MTIKDTGLRTEDKVEEAGSAEGCLLIPHSSLPDPAALQRVRWRCRRGLLELDIIFVRFIEAHYLQLSVEERQTFEELLDLPDNPLWDMVSGRIDAGSAVQAALVLKINAL
jgi:antitoxin CptB